MLRLTIAQYLNVFIHILLEQVKINPTGVFDQLLGLVDAFEFVFGSFDCLLNGFGHALPIDFYNAPARWHVWHVRVNLGEVVQDWAWVLPVAFILCVLKCQKYF